MLKFNILRFARVKRFRFDKNVKEIADISEVKKRFEMEGQRKLNIT